MNTLKTIICIICGIALIGCTTIVEPTIESTKTWEQHYKSVEEFKVGTQNITLEKDETIWVMSNKTLKRLLINVK